MSMNQGAALIALGANMPHSGASLPETIRAAIAAVQAVGLQVVAESRLYSTPCFPPGAGPDYVNAAIAVHTPLAAPQILQILHDIEAEFGRTRQVRWGMRTLDLDLLALGDAVLPDLATYRHWQQLAPEQQQQLAPDQLILPHPRMHERGFVLVPLADIAPQWRHPVLGQSVADLCAALPPLARAEVQALP